MAVNKVINKSTKSHGAMRNVLEYILRDDKIREGYVEITGPGTSETLNYDNYHQTCDAIYRSWLEEKRLWEKDYGRMYSHNIISFHKDEQVSPSQVLEIGKEFVERFFPYHQCVIGVHQDKDHLHCHIVTNTVSFLDGSKLHQTRNDLDEQKRYTNALCLDRGLSIAKKGHHFDGTKMEQGETIAWSKDKYNLLNNDQKNSYVLECGIAVVEAKEISTGREEFIREMEERGWKTIWTDSRKYITFENENGKKVRDSNISKTFNMDISKEALLYEFERQNEARLNEAREQDVELAHSREFEHYYTEVESALSGAMPDREAVRSITDDYRTEGRTSYEWETGGSGTDTEALLRNLDAQERASKQKRDNSILERQYREAEQERRRIEAEQREIARSLELESEGRRKISRSHSHGIER